MTFSDCSLLVFLTFGILLAGSAACLSSLGLLCILRKFHLQTFLAQEFFPPICHSLAVDTMGESCPKRQCWTRFEGRLSGFSPFMEQQNARGHLYDALFWALFSYSPLFPSWANGSWPPLGTTGNHCEQSGSSPLARITVLIMASCSGLALTSCHVQGH